MAVNYLSKSVETSPYVLPVSLDLLAKVNSYKQSLFYQNAQKAADTLGTISNTDIANATQKQYLNDAVNGVVKKINDYGAIDYSDLNVSNSIENLGSEIYKDANIMNGIASTKKIRQMQANYQKMANDPKLNKYYSQAYETYDYEHYVKPYVNSDNLQATYEGPINPTIYTGNPLEKAAKLIKQSKPEIVSEVVNGQATGGYINTQTQERYSPQSLVAAFDSVIDGQTKTELVKNAWYTLDYSNRKADGTPVYGEDDYAKMLTDQHQGVLDNMEAQLKANNAAILGSGLDATARATIQNDNKKLVQQIENFKTAQGENEAAFRSTFKRDKDSALYQLYVGGLKQDLHKIFGATQTKTALKPDLAQMQEWKKEIAYINKGFKYDGMNADGTPRLTPTGTAKTPVDPKTDFTVIDVNTETGEEAAKNKLTTQSIILENNKVYGDLNAATFDYIKNAAIADTALWEAFQFKSQVTNDANSAPSTISSTVLNKVAQGDSNPGLTIEDLERVVKHKEQADAAGLSPKAVEFIQGVVSSYDKLVRGVDNDQPINTATRNFMNVYQDKLSIINSNKKLVADVTAKVMERDGYNKPDLFSTTVQPLGKPVSAGGNIPDDVYYQRKRDMENRRAVVKNAKQININAAIDKELEAVSNRNNYFSIILQEDQDKTKFKQLIPGLENLIKVTNKDIMDGEGYKDESIQPVTLTKSPEGWRVGYTIKDKKDNIYYSVANRNVKGDFKDVILTDAQAQKLGAQILPYEGLEREAYVNGKSERDYYVPKFLNVKTDGTIAKNPKPVKIQVMRTTPDRNNSQYVAKVFIPSLNDWKVVPFKQGDEKYANTANSAYYYAASLLDDYSVKNINGWGLPATDNAGNITTIKNAETFYNDIIVPNQNN